MNLKLQKALVEEELIPDFIYQDNCECRTLIEIQILL